MKHLQIFLVFIIISVFFLIFLPSDKASNPYPIVVATSTGSDNGATTHFAILPGGITNGDVLLVCMALDGGPTTLTWPSGWEALFNPGASGGWLECRFHYAIGNEGTQITITASASTRFAEVGYRISGGSIISSPSAVNPPSVATNFNPDPPNVIGSPVENRIYIVVYSWIGSATNNAYPSGFTDNQVLKNVGTAIALTIASQNINGGNENPGTATLSGSVNWAADTITIRPTSETITNLSVNILANPDEGDEPLTVNFYSNVTGGVSPYTYFWIFGDGNISTLASPSHIYTQNGTFIVELTVKDNNTIQDLATDSFSVHVKAKEQTNFALILVIISLLVIAFISLFLIGFFEKFAMVGAALVSFIIGILSWTWIGEPYVPAIFTFLGAVCIGLAITQKK